MLHLQTGWGGGHLTHLGEDGKGLWVQNKDILILCANHKTADCIFICHILVQCTYACDDRLEMYTRTDTRTRTRTHREKKHNG